MASRHRHQRNPYQGFPPRPWVRIHLRNIDGSVKAFHLLADTGNPFELIIAVRPLRSFARKEGPNRRTNFGLLVGGWVEVSIPEINFEEKCLGFGNDAVERAARASSPSFDGLIGLPLLRRFEFGGNAEWFWLRETRSRGKKSKS